MKAFNILRPPLVKTPIYPSHLKFRVADHAKGRSQEMGTTPLWKIIMMISIVMGLIIFLGIKLL